MKFIKFIVLFLILFFAGCDKKDDKKSTSIFKESNKTLNLEQNEAILTTNLDAPITIKFTNDDLISVTKTDDGINIENSDKATIFFFFTSWCPPCLIQMQVLNNLANKFKNDINIYGIVVKNDEDPSENKINLEDIKFQISQSLENETLMDAMGGIKNIPFMSVYEKSGKHYKDYLGIIPEEMLEIEIKKAIKW